MRASVSATAPVNIALVKYWGKAAGCGGENHPATPSLSVTLRTLLDLTAVCAAHPSAWSDAGGLQCTDVGGSDWALLSRTTVECASGEDALELNGASVPLPPRLRGVLAHLRTRASLPPVRIVSRNAFPTAAGLASSASGGAALAACLVALVNGAGTAIERSVASAGSPNGTPASNLPLANTGEMDRKTAALIVSYPAFQFQVSEVARRLSGSACRSAFGGFVAWVPHEGGRGSAAAQLLDERYWPDLRCLVFVLDAGAKGVPSTEGMRATQETSMLYAARPAQARAAMAAVSDAIERRDFGALASAVMRESNALHALCADTWPPLEYVGAAGRCVQRAVRQLNSACGGSGARAAYTFDAGPNAFVLCLDADAEDVCASVCGALREEGHALLRVLLCAPGPGAALDSEAGLVGPAL